jgi:hypothetical protein
MLACTVRILPDQPLVGQHSNPIWGLLARELLPLDTRRVDQLALPLGCGLGLSVPATRLIRSVPSPAAALGNFAPSSVETCRGGGGDITAGCGARARCPCVSR